jgi:hypothetical protein
VVIANPIYDIAFKFLMEDERVAKFFIGTLLDETIEEITVIPQVYRYADKMDWLAVYRLDFVATISTKEGRIKMVLVKVQKARNSIDLIRWQKFLIEHDRKEEAAGRKKQTLPVLNIYLLLFQIKGIESSLFKVNHEYIDLLTHKVIDRKSEFIERLNHDCFVVQLGRIESQVGTKLEKLLSIFEQNYFYDDCNILKGYNHVIDDDNIKRMVDRLHYVGTEPPERKKIEDEKEAYRVLDWATKAKVNELLQSILTGETIVEDKHKAIEDLEKCLAESEFYEYSF